MVTLLVSDGDMLRLPVSDGVTDIVLDNDPVHDGVSDTLCDAEMLGVGVHELV